MVHYLRFYRPCSYLPCRKRLCTRESNCLFTRRQGLTWYHSRTIRRLTCFKSLTRKCTGTHSFLIQLKDLFQCHLWPDTICGVTCGIILFCDAMVPCGATHGLIAFTTALMSRGTAFGGKALTSTILFSCGSFSVSSAGGRRSVCLFKRSILSS